MLAKLLLPTNAPSSMLCSMQSKKRPPTASQWRMQPTLPLRSTKLFCLILPSAPTSTLVRVQLLAHHAFILVVYLKRCVELRFCVVPDK